jgi:hypothetical protein
MQQVAFKKLQKRNEQMTPTSGVEKLSRKEPENRKVPLPGPVRLGDGPQGTSHGQIALGALRLGVVLWFLWWLLGRH